MLVKMNMGYKFLLKPNKEQAIAINKTIGCSRKVYNLLLADKIQFYKDNKSMLNRTPAYYKSIPEFAYLKEVDSSALANAQMNLDKAYTNFFQKRSNFPKFHKKGKNDTYTTNCINNNIRIDGNKIRLPKIGFVKFVKHRELPTDGVIKHCTISKKADKYYISINIEYETNLIMKEKTNLTLEDCIGFDYSSPNFYIDSNGSYPEVMHFYREAEPRIARLQRRLSKKKKGSNNYKKQQILLQRAYKKVSNKRDDCIQKLSKEYTDNYSILVFEDINLKNLSRTLKLGKSTMDNGFGKFRTLCEQKAYKKGGYTIKIDKWYPSSKTCSNCGYVNSKLTLNDREWTCPICGVHHNRDNNAAQNIQKEGFRLFQTL